MKWKLILIFFERVYVVQDIPLVGLHMYFKTSVCEKDGNVEFIILIGAARKGSFNRDPFHCSVVSMAKASSWWCTRPMPSGHWQLQ